MQRSVSQSPIVIAGAGPVGLFCAVLLVRAGQRVVVLERNGSLAMDMRASTFHPATLDLLGRCGLDESLISRGSITQGWQYMVHGTKDHAVFDLEVISDLTDHPYRLQCEQFHFTNIAIESLIGNPLFEIRFNHELLEADNRDDEVSLHIQNPGGEYELHAPWLIAADGWKSKIRRCLGLAFEGNEYREASVTLLLDYPFQDHVPGLLGVNYVWTDRAYYCLMQIRDLWRFSYSPDPQEPVEDVLSEQSTQARIQSLFPRNRPYKVLLSRHYSLQQRCLDAFRAGRVLFAGDAAHLNSPAGGMGMNSGMHDAQSLVDHLLPVLEGEDDALLDRYSRRRRTVALEEVQRLSGRNHRWYRENDPEKRAAIWRELMEIVDDPERTRAFLLDSSMIASRLREQEIE